MNLTKEDATKLAKKAIENLKSMGSLQKRRKNGCYKSLTDRICKNFNKADSFRFNSKQ